jgi:valyl-tRNA synthetase
MSLRFLCHDLFQQRWYDVAMKLSKVYDPTLYESDIYALWEKSGAFEAHPEKKAERFTISMPPPNETGTLSIGHALFITLQDIMIRHARQKGMDALWLPGTDHAALPVNALIEKQLADKGTNKHEIGREEFLRITREFAGNSRSTMLGQMRAVGASADWSRLRYTLDDALNRTVNEVFVKMYNDGLIYRGNRIINWDPNLETTVSDDEVVRVEERAKFYTFQYGPFQISTARPETKFGDKYVVMHPEDKRYSKYKHGDTFEAEWINGKVTATVIKDEAVDPSFGTGVMTITPWHDHTDFEIAERHNLDREQIIDFHGNLLPIAEEFAGMPIAEARPKIVEKLKQKGLVVTIDENYLHSIAVNDRGKGIIEPQIKLQWFVDVNKPAVEWKGKKQTLKEVMQDTVRSGDIAIMPARFEKVYFHWIDNLRDWCISRQIWWGHRIPVWYRTDTDGQQETYVGVQPPTDQSEGWHEWEQDPDTLDTWFSSALWTWSTLIDPEKAQDYSLSLEDLLASSKDYQTYHPTTVMETGWDILFFWVARMILATTYATGQIPFKTVYLHGMVRAEDGKKMSKSRPESIIDPLAIIPKYGTDALRMALIMSVAPGNDQNWGWDKIEANRNFANKLWNIARFSEDKLGDDFTPTRTLEPKNIADHWILHNVNYLCKTVSEHLEKFRFSEAYDVTYHFVWDDLADWYIEASKTELNREVLAYTLDTVLKVMHPFAPFVTETIWQTLKWEGDSLLIQASWPEPAKADAKQAKIFEKIKDIVNEIRFITSSLNVRKPRLYHSSDPVLQEHAALIKNLAGISEITEAKDGEGLKLAQTSAPAWLDLDRKTIQQFVGQLTAKVGETQKTIAQLEGRLANKAYVSNAPKDLVDETRQQLKDATALYEKQQSELARFKS